jgi:ubiquinone/menaquinone biosynthesis C-methylase UbiE
MGGGNYHPDFGDYHDLGKFDNETFDIIFVIEALCHSTDKSKVFAEARRVLKTDGIFVVIDGYSNKNQMAKDEKTALLLVEKGMALENFEYYDSVVSKAKENKFKVELEEDVSRFVLPTMERFERKAVKFFRFPKLAKIATNIFPKEFLYNAIAGYLSATLIRFSVCSYMITVFRKE